MAWRANSKRSSWGLRLSPLLASIAFVASVLLHVLGCASQHFDGSVFRNGSLSFLTGKPPAEWRPISVSDALIAYRDDRLRATVAVNGRCGKDGDDVPLEALTRHLFIYFTDRQVLEQKRVAMDGREALRTEMFAKLDGVRQGFIVFVLKKDGCVYDFLYVSDPATLEAGARRFEHYVSAFRTMAR